MCHFSSKNIFLFLHTVTAVNCCYLLLTAEGFLRVDVAIEVSAIKDDALADLQKRNRARPLKLTNCWNCACEIRRCLGNSQKTRLCR